MGFADLIGAPKTLWAFISQVGVGAPTMQVVSSPYPPISGKSLGVWSYVGVGSYNYTLAGAFPAGSKTVTRITGGDDGASLVGLCDAVRLTSNIIRVFTTNFTGVPSDNVLTSAFLEIIVLGN